MKISKDEAMILADALSEAKYSYLDLLSKNKYDNIVNLGSFDALESALIRYGKDKRRTGRTSQNSFTDMLKRFCLKRKNVKCNFCSAPPLPGELHCEKCSVFCTP